MKALLIVDMQKGCFKPYSSKLNTLKVVDNINLLSSKFRELGYMVIDIAHDGTKEGYLFPDTEDFKFLPELNVDSSDFYITKEANDSFYKTNLEEVLKNHDVDELCICGQATNFCLDCTIKIALYKDYKIYIPSDAHTTKTTEGIEASMLVGYYNWLWSNLTPTKHEISVVSTRVLLEQIAAMH